MKAVQLCLKCTFINHCWICLEISKPKTNPVRWYTMGLDLFYYGQTIARLLGNSPLKSNNWRGLSWCPHYLTPSFFVPYFWFVLEVHEHFRFTRQCPQKSTTIRRGIFGWWSYSNVRFMNMARSFIEDGDQHLHESIDLVPVIIDVTDFEPIIQEYVGCGTMIMTLWP